MVCMENKQLWDDVNQLREIIYAQIEWTNERDVEQYTYICFSEVKACQDMPMWWENLLTNTDWLQDLAEEYLQRYPVNGFLAVKTIELWYNSFYYEYKRKHFKSTLKTIN